MHSYYKHGFLLLDQWAFRRDTLDENDKPVKGTLEETYLVGYIYGHPDMDDGDYVSTASITSMVQNKVITSDGLIYYLMTPDQEYLDFLGKDGLPAIRNILQTGKN